MRVGGEVVTGVWRRNKVKTDQERGHVSNPGKKVWRLDWVVALEM